MIILGQFLFVWIGMIAFLLMLLAVIAVKTQGKIKIFRGLHQKIAPFAVLFIIIHVILAAMAVFFKIWI
jgi:hypothetical protein